MEAKFDSFNLQALRKIALVAVLGAWLLLPCQTVLAQGATATASLFQTGSGLSTFNITNNQIFQLTLMLNNNFVSSGITYFLAVSNNGSGLFQITARDLTLSPYPEAAPITLPCLLSPVCNQDLGSTINGGVGSVPPGNYTVAVLTLQALNVPAGQYTIFLDPRAVVTDRTGGGFNDVSVTGGIATINVIPEPGTTILAVLGGIVLLIQLSRTKRAV
jgi:hypothetical protein